MIEIEYIVKDKQGVERLRTADKKAADAYDKALEIADRLAQWVREEQVASNLPDQTLEELTIFFARNARTVERLLKGKESPAPAEKSAQSSSPDLTAKDDRTLRTAQLAPLKAAS